VIVNVVSIILLCSEEYSVVLVSVRVEGSVDTKYIESFAYVVLILVSVVIFSNFVSLENLKVEICVDDNVVIDGLVSLYTVKLVAELLIPNF
jgi:hypothetical protein